MKFSLNSSPLNSAKTDCIILGVHKKGKFSRSGQLIDKASNKYLSHLLKRGDIDAELGQTTLLQHIPGITAERVMLVGLGTIESYNSSQYYQAITSSTKTLLATPCKKVINCLAEFDVEQYSTDWRLRQATIAMEDAAYQYDQTKSTKQKKHPLQHVSFSAGQKTSKQALSQGQAIAAGMTLCKDLANLPGNICTPTYLAKQATQLAKEFKSLSSKVLNEAEMKKLGMNTLLSVSAGSKQPAKLIIIEHKGASKKTAKPIVLVGKGITFDTGGISIKPSSTMDEMKFDMGGAASIFGTMRAIADMNLPMNVIGIIAAAENMPGGNATKPGDIVTSMSGQTVEILNTDAEGRLVLCDALTYAQRFKPDVVIDIATLTGAIVVALGDDVSGCFSNNDQLAHDLLSAAKSAQDPAWHMPLWRKYDKQLSSNFADLQNIGSRWGGAITAACFLAHFTEDYKWAHIDCAGTAWVSGANKGATGRPVPLLTQYLLNACS